MPSSSGCIFVRFGKLHHQRDRRAKHRNLAGQQEVIDERSPIHDDGGREDIRHEGLHPGEHGVREDFEPFGRLQHSAHAHGGGDEEHGQ